MSTQPRSTYRLNLGAGCLGIILSAALLIGIVAGLGVGLEVLVDALRQVRRFDRIRIGLIVAATAASALWIAAMGWVRIRRQPITPPSDAPTAELRPEPPAVANMLVNDFRVTRDALPATVLDLAARGAVDIEESPTGSYQVRLRRGEPEGLTAYEARVHWLLRQRVAGGVVPAEALTTGPTDHARSWWRAFRGEVVAEAKARGLSEDLWSAAAVRSLGFLAAMPAALIALAAFHAGAGIAAFVAAGAALSTVKGWGRQRHTDAGLRAAAGWLGIRRYLRQAAFADLPPTAVAVWERYLPYAAALGVAADAVRAIPMGADDDHRAWSAASGQWRQVRIRYPRMWPPGWGMHPAAALLTGLAIMAVSGFMLMFSVRFAWPEGGPDLLRLVNVLFVAIPLLAGTMGLMGSVLGILDLGPSREVSGMVLRLRSYKGDNDSQPRCFVALDDGRSPAIAAWRVRPPLYRSAGLREYAPATASVTPNLGYVRWIRPAGRP